MLVAPTLARSAAQRGTTGVLANVSSFAAFMARSAMRLPGARAQAKARPKPALLRSLDRVRPLLQQQQYMRAKLAHLVFLRALARRLAAPRLVDVHSVDPGICVTDLSQIHWFSRLMGRLGVYRPLEACARAVAHACVPAPGTNGAVMRDYEPIPCVLVGLLPP